MQTLPEQVRKQREVVDSLYDELNRETEDRAAAEAEAAEPSTQESVPAQPDNDRLMEQRYRTLQGMYNAEVPRLQSQNKDLANRVQQLEGLLATMSQQKANPPQPVKLVTDKDVEEFGEDTIDVVRRAAREEYVPALEKIAHLEKTISQLQANVVPQVQNVLQNQAVSADQQFWAGLQQHVPNWREVNNHPYFHQWLLEPDPLTGVKRQSILEDAQRRYDLARVVAFFNTWIGMNSGETKAKPSSSKLETQIAPGRSRGAGGSASTSQQGRTYTPGDIEKFFTDVRMGKYKGKEEERNRIERDIFAAQKDGRIVVNG